MGELSRDQIGYGDQMPGSAVATGLGFGGLDRGIGGLDSTVGES